MTCQDCSSDAPAGGLLIVSADLGNGAFLAVLCDICWHRRQYRAKLQELKRQRARSTRLQTTPELNACPA